MTGKRRADQFISPMLYCVGDFKMLGTATGELEKYLWNVSTLVNTDLTNVLLFCTDFYSSHLCILNTGKVTKIVVCWEETLIGSHKGQLSSSISPPLLWMLIPEPVIAMALVSSCSSSSNTRLVVQWFAGMLKAAGSIPSNCKLLY